MASVSPSSYQFQQGVVSMIKVSALSVRGVVAARSGAPASVAARALWVALAACVVLLAAGTAAASAAPEPYERLGSVFSGGPDGTIVHHQRVALYGSTGQVYLADDVNDQIRVFDPTATSATEGSPFGSGEVTDPLGVAVDQSTGAIYVSDDNDIIKYTSPGVLDTNFTGPGVTGPVAFDQAHDELVVADLAADLVRHYDPDGTAAGASFDGSDGGTAFTGLQDVAAEADGDVIVVDSDGDPALGTGTSRVERYSAAGTHLDTFGPVPGAATVAVAPGTGEVIVSGNQDAVNRNESPTLSVFDPAVPGTSAEMIPAGDAWRSSTVRGMAVADDGSARLYVVTDLGVPYFGLYGNISLQVYDRALRIAPSASIDTATKIEETHAVLRGTVNPNRHVTTYWFEYGLTTSYGTSIPKSRDAEAGSGRDDVDVRRQIVGLAANTTYHYRLVAQNAFGTTASDDRTFRTPSDESVRPPSDIACPNAAVRAQQHATYLPDCRAYEQVSAVDKNGIDVQAILRISADGRSIAWMSLGAYANTPSTGVTATYVGTRGPDGWQTSPRNPIFRGDNLSISSNLIGGGFLNADLSRFLFISSGAFDPADTDLDEPFHFGTDDVYEVGADGEPVWISKGVDGLGNQPERHAFATAASPDFNTIFFRLADQLTLDAPVDGGLYRWRAGVVSLVGRDTDGVPLSGAFVGRGLTQYTSNGTGHVGEFPDSEGVSADGTRFVYATPVGGAGHRLFLHEDGKADRELSLSRVTGAVGEPRTATFEAAAQDLTNLIIWSRDRLTDDAPAVPGGSDADFDSGYYYKYDAVTDTLSYYGPGGYNLNTSVYKLSQDLEYMYFLDNHVLASGAVAGQANVYVRSPEGVDLVATVTDPDDGFSTISKDFFSLASSETAMSRDGRTFIFASRGAPTGEQTNGAPQIYRYDAVGKDLGCITCGPQAAESRILPRQDVYPLAPRSLLDDGTIIMTTAESHAVRDSNGKPDVYTYKNGVWGLLSDGTSKYGSAQAGASYDGRDIYITTRSALVGQDNDTGNIDVYDVRVNGGWMEPERHETGCQGEACHPAAPSPPSTLTAASVTFGASGNGLRPVRIPAAKVSAAKTVRGVIAKIKVRVSAAGTITVSGTQLRRVGRSVTKAGTYVVPVTLSAKARRTLARKRSLVVRASVRFGPKGGKATSVAVRLTFKAIADRKGRR